MKVLFYVVPLSLDDAFKVLLFFLDCLKSRHQLFFLGTSPVYCQCTGVVSLSIKFYYSMKKRKRKAYSCTAFQILFNRSSEGTFLSIWEVTCPAHMFLLISDILKWKCSFPTPFLFKSLYYFCNQFLEGNYNPK